MFLRAVRLALKRSLHVFSATPFAKRGYPACVLRVLKIGFAYSTLLLIAVATLAPLLWMIGTSLHLPLSAPPTPATLFTPDSAQFLRWEELGVSRDQGLPSTPELELVIDRDRTLVAVFTIAGRPAPPPPSERASRMPRFPSATAPGEAVLEVTADGPGRVMLDPPGGRYPIGSKVRLLAIAHGGLANYGYVLSLPELPVLRFALNSVLTAAGVVLLQLALCTSAAYAFARLRFVGRELLFVCFLLTMMVPPQVLIVPLYRITAELGWLNTYAGLIFPYQYLSTGFGTFLLRQFFVTVPRALDDAARIDGCGELGVLWHVILPSSRAALATVAAFAFVWTWTEFYWPLLATSSMRMRTLETGLSVFRDSYAGTNWPLQMAAATVVVLPALGFFLLLQRYFVRGAVMSGVKG